MEEKNSHSDIFFAIKMKFNRLFNRHLCVTFDSSHVAKVWNQLLRVGALFKVNAFASQQHVTKFVHILCGGCIFSPRQCGFPAPEEFNSRL